MPGCLLDLSGAQADEEAEGAAEEEVAQALPCSCPLWWELEELGEEWADDVGDDEREEEELEEDEDETQIGRFGMVGVVGPLDAVVRRWGEDDVAEVLPEVQDEG